MISVGVIILAAGASSRMGRAKMLMPWNGTTVIGHLVELWRQLDAAQLAVVYAADDADVAAGLDQLDLPPAVRISNPFPARGMFSSIQCAARWDGWNRHLTHWAIALGDQPHVRAATLRALVDFAARNPASICQPAFGGRARHPVIMPQFAWKELAASEDETLRNFLHARSGHVQLLEVDDPGVALDLDVPADYERALNLARGCSDRATADEEADQASRQETH
jgi:molybdenum cofactor cytidylyltransferase